MTTETAIPKRSPGQFQHRLMSPFPLDECVNRLSDLSGTPTGNAFARETCYQSEVATLDSHTNRFYVYWGTQPTCLISVRSRAEGILHRQADGTTVVFVSIRAPLLSILKENGSSIIGLALAGMILLTYHGHWLALVVVLLLVIPFAWMASIAPLMLDRTERSLRRIVEETVTGVYSPYPFSWLYDLGKKKAKK